QFEGVGTSYHVPLVLEMSGLINLKKLQGAVDKLVKQYEVLRTSFVLVQEPMQVIEDTVAIPVTYASCLEKDKDQKIQNFITPFDLRHAPLMHVMLLDVEDERSYIVLDIHHIICDGIGMKQLVSTLITNYEEQDTKMPTLSYKDYAVWHEHYMESEEMAKQKAFWHAMYQAGIPTVDFQTDYPRQKAQQFEGGVVTHTMSEQHTNTFEKLAQKMNISMNSLLFGAYAVLLQKYSQEGSFVVGSLVSGRTHPDIQEMLGMFNNYLPVRIEIDEEVGLDEQLQVIHQQLTGCYENQDYPYDLLIEDFKARKSASRNPFFDTMLIYHNELDELQVPDIDGLTIKPYPIQNETAKLDFKLDIYYEEGQLKCVWEYAKSLYQQETIERMANHYVTLLENMAKHADQKVSHYTMMSHQEKTCILEQFNETTVAYSKDKTLDSIFAEQVAKTPNQVAARFAGESITFKELDERSNRLAQVLKSKGVEANSIVGLMVERSLEMIIGILGILKAGGAYMPISPDYPTDRIRYMLEDSEAKALLTQTRFMDLMTYECVIDLDSPATYEADARPIESSSHPRSLAYVIYTSGSTGKPKGVMIEHTSAVNRLEWMQKRYPIGEQDTILQKTPFTFDVSVWELFWWMFTGSNVYFLQPEGEKDPAMILEAIETQRITTMHFVPSMLALFLEYYEGHQDAYDLSSLRQVFASGEALTIGQVKQFNELLHKRYGTTLHNLYGPTEATVDVSYYDCPVQGEITGVPIGKPIDNTKLYVLDKKKHLQPIGVPGELYISGVGVARGYLKREELTNEKFMDDPYDAQYRMYRSGDLAKWLPNGDIEYLGRIDNQVKIRGLRIELGEIETRLAEHGDIYETAVVVKTDTQGNPYLCGYYTATKPLTVEALKQHIIERLPDYMVPSYFVYMDKMPLSANGKLDRKMLPEPQDHIVTETQYVEASTDTQKQLVSIWQRLLEVEKIGIEDHFFDLGGHSLKAARLVSEIQHHFNVEMTLNQVFEKLTVRELAAFIDTLATVQLEAIETAPKMQYYPLSAAQERLYILNQIDGGVTYHLPSALKIEGELDSEHFEKVLSQMIARHGQLRTSFHMIEGKPVQKVHETLKVDLEQVTCKEEDVNGLIQGFIRPFDFEQAPLIRFLLIHTDKDRHYFVFDMHHIISDGVSSVILAREFMALYAGIASEPLQVTYEDYVWWQQGQKDKLKDQEAFWLDNLKGELVPLDMPTDKVRPAVQEYVGAKKSFALSKELTDKIKKVATQKGLTPYMFCVAAYNILLHHYTGQEDLLVGTPVAGRSRFEFENVVGMFVNTVVLRNHVDGQKTANVFLEEVKKHTLGAFENQDYQFEELIQKLHIKRDVSRNPLFDTMFVYQNMGLTPMTLEGIEFAQYPLENKVSKFDLTFELVEQETLMLNIEYATNLYFETTIARMANHYITLLEALVHDQSKAIADYRILTKQEEDAILNHFNDTKTPYSTELTLDAVFNRQVERSPERIAAVFGEDTLTYKELNERANSVAHRLKQKGVGPDSVVGLMVERSLEMIIGIVAIIKAGGAYMPISPTYPEDRIRYMLEDSQAKVLLTQERFISQVSYDEIIDLEEASLYTSHRHNILQTSRVDSLAYIIYTSGSTGKPKGVMIEHTSAINRIEWMQKKYPIYEGDVILQKTPFTFDVSVWEIFWWMFTGSSVYFLKPEGEKDPSEILKAIQERQITTMHFVPSMLGLFLEYYELHQETYDLSSLKQVFASGEALTTSQVEKFNKLLHSKYHTRLYNLYGPTEATVDVSYYDCPSDEHIERVPIGKPIDNTRLYVLDKQKRLQPIGVAGELYISGVGVARGYLNRPELTAEKFMEDPYYEGYRMYRSGDLTKWLANGEIEYLGRIDNQVKIRGLRIELGEIEARLEEYEGINEVAVTVRKDDQGSQYLCGYYTGPETLSVETLRKHITQKLPDYMVPAYFTKLDTMPLSANGKLDRKALPAPQMQVVTGTEYVKPKTETQKHIASIWESLLGQDKVGIKDNFFDLGGNSLLLVRMHGEIEKVYPNTVRVTDLFQYTQIRTLAEYIDEMGRGEIERHQVKGMHLPSNYITGQNGAELSDVVAMTLEASLKQRMQHVAMGLEVSTQDIMVATYAYLIAQVASDNKPCVEVNTQEGLLVSLEMCMDGYSEFGLFIQSIKHLQKEKVAYELKQAQTISQENEIIFAYIQQGIQEADYELIQHYDVILRVQEEGSIDFFYNVRKLNQTAMKQFIGLYLKLLVVVLGQVEKVLA
ncbi:MAG: amino acid adenylation domain-containing protein, partial [Cellulosilyticaceae bacterium]